jgi:hypothetical protein
MGLLGFGLPSQALVLPRTPAERKKEEAEIRSPHKHNACVIENKDAKAAEGKARQGAAEQQGNT